MIADFLDKVVCEDILHFLAKLPDKSVDMVYGDPDYNVGLKYGSKQYIRSFDEYIEWYIRLAKESLRVLKDDGNMFLINVPKQNAHLRVKYLDSVCYEVMDYIWLYQNNIGFSRHHLMAAHRSILHCIKTRDNRFYKDQIVVPYKDLYHPRVKRKLARGSKGKMPYDWFYFDIMRHGDAGKLNHPHQHPWQLSDMLIKSCTVKGDTVLVLFGGSGTEIEACRAINRDYISAEINREYYDMITKRLKKFEDRSCIR